MPVRPNAEPTQGHAGEPASGPVPIDFSAEIEKTLRLSRAAPSPAPVNDRAEPEDAWSETLDLVVHATETITAAQGRIADLELRNRELETRFAEELRMLSARVSAAEQELTRTEARRIAAEERAERAHQRAETATGWLRRIHDHATKHLQR